jgi:hypothetical protein
VELFVVELVQKRDVPFRLRVHPAFFFELVNRQEGTTGLGTRGRFLRARGRLLLYETPDIEKR